MNKSVLHTNECDELTNPASETKMQGFSASQIADSRISRNNGNADEFARGIYDDNGKSVHHNNDNTDELAQLIERVDHDNEYVVGRVLKKSDFEETQLVYKCEVGGTKSGPFIRKYLNIEAGVGSAYEKLYRAQRQGQSFLFLPTIHECYFLHNTLIVVMEYVQGETLQEVVYRCDPSVDLVKEVFPRLCSAVRELHEKFNPPLIHRDLKPGNIVMSFNRLTLIDFGIAREYRDDSDNDTVRFGTREYAPPEQFGYGQTDMRSDVYALGMLLYYCLTEETADARVRKKQFVDKRIPEQLRAVIAKACAFDPQGRYASALELEEAFTQACGFLGQGSLSSCSSLETPGVSAYESSLQFPPPSGNPVIPFASVTEFGNTGTGKTPRDDQGAKSSKVFNNNKDIKSLGYGKNKKYSEKIGLDREPSKGSSRGKMNGFVKCSHAIQQAFSVIPLWVGIVWDVLLILVFALVFAGCVASAIDPSDSGLAAYPFWYRAYGSLGFVGLSWLSITYVLLDKRLLFNKVPQVKRFSFPLRALIFALGVPLSLLLVFILLTFMLTPPTISWH